MLLISSRREATLLLLLNLAAPEGVKNTLTAEASVPKPDPETSMGLELENSAGVVAPEVGVRVEEKTYSAVTAASTSALSIWPPKYMSSSTVFSSPAF